MNKDFQLEQLRRMLMNPGLKSGLYLLETDLADEQIETCIRGNSSFKYVSGKLIPTSKGNVFELLIVGLCHQCQDTGIRSLMSQLMTADERRRDVIIYSLTIQILKHFSTGGITVLHVLGKIDLSSIESEDLDKFDAALTCIDDTVVVLCTRKNMATLKGGSIINLSLKGLNKNRFMESILKKVHISYKHDKKYDEAIEAIKNGLKKNNISFSIDVQDIKYRDDIEKYEKEIGSADRVIMFVTALYLKSIDCMFEMTEIFKNVDVRDRVFPVVDMEPVSRNRDGLKEIKEYWQEQMMKASFQMRTEFGNSDYVINDLSKINAIIKVLDEFWDYIVHINTGNFKNLIENDAVLLMEEIQRATPNRTVELDERIVTMGKTQPIVIRKTTQKGEKSVYVENNTGTIIIGVDMPKRRYFSTEIREIFRKPYIKVYFLDDSIATDAKEVVERLNVVKSVNISPSSSKDHPGNTLTVYPKSMVDAEDCEKEVVEALNGFFSRGVLADRKPVRNDAYFNGIADKIIKDLDKARVSIHVCIAWFTNQRIADKLVEKYKQGIDVKVIFYDDHTNSKFGVNIDGIPFKAVRGSRGGLMHNKYCVIDNQIVITGSYNWSENAENKNDENTAVMYDYDRASDYSVEFRRMFSSE